MHEIKADFHTHTKYSREPVFLKKLNLRAMYSPEKLVKTAIKRGLNSLAVTDHDEIEGARQAKKYIQKNNIKNFTLIKGEEITTENGHIIGIGLEERIPSNLSPEETMDRIKSQGGVSIVPHAFNRLGIGERIHTLSGIDAIEIFNPYNKLNSVKLHPPRLYEKIAKQRNCATVIGTDAHTLEDIGKIYTKVQSEYGVDNILNAIKSKRTSCIDNTAPAGFIKTIVKTLALTTCSFRKHPLKNKTTI